MSDLSSVKIEMINLKRRIAVSDIGLGKIESFLDANGDETQDASIAAIAIIEWFVGGWSQATIAEFDGELS